ncbi:MAG TPA: hypothetical protein VD866_01285 [Urbifossiella sp.]|nr:hypothetical protein [Urbifossiella sp.]
MTPPILYPMLQSLHEFMFEHVRLMETDPDEFYHRIEGFVTFVVCRSFREGARAVLKQAEKPNAN